MVHIGFNAGNLHKSHSPVEFGLGPVKAMVPFCLAKETGMNWTKESQSVSPPSSLPATTPLADSLTYCLNIFMQKGSFIGFFFVTFGKSAGGVPVKYGCDWPFISCSLSDSGLCVSRRNVQTSSVWSSHGTGLNCTSVGPELTIQSVPLSTADASLR